MYGGIDVLVLGGLVVLMEGLGWCSKLCLYNRLLSRSPSVALDLSSRFWPWWSVNVDKEGIISKLSLMRSDVSY